MAPRSILLTQERFKESQPSLTHQLSQLEEFHHCHYYYSQTIMSQGHFMLHRGRSMVTKAKPVDISCDTAKLGAMLVTKMAKATIR